jgi:hypothetical protein
VAALNDPNRNPLQAIAGLADIRGGGMADKIVSPAKEIEQIIRRLDIGWVKSTKIHDFLIKQYGMGK